MLIVGCTDGAEQRNRPALLELIESIPEADALARLLTETGHILEL